MPKPTSKVRALRIHKDWERRAEGIADWFTVKEGDRVAQLVLERVREAIDTGWWWAWKLTCRADLYSGDCRGRGAGRKRQRRWWLWEHRMTGPLDRREKVTTKFLTVGVGLGG